MLKKSLFALLFLLAALSADGTSSVSEGEKLFKSYCWGCHHQTAQAFGPSFRSIANRRDKVTIIAMIADANATYRQLGYRRNSMPSFADLKPRELEALADYILSFKDKK